MMLLDPVVIGNTTLRNRIAMPAMHLNYTPECTVTDQLVAFYEARARGGVGLIVAGGCRIDENSGNRGPDLGGKQHHPAGRHGNGQRPGTSGACHYLFAECKRG